MAKAATKPVKRSEPARQITSAQDFPPALPIDIIDIDPAALEDHDKSFLNAIIAFMQKKDVDGAIAHAQKRSEEFPRNPTLVNLIAALYLQKRDTEQAEKYLLKASRLGPQDTKIANNLACVHILRRSYRTAETILQAGIRHTPPNFAEYYHNLGLCLFYQDKFDLARVELERALQLEPLADTYALIAYAELLATNYKVAEHTLLQGLGKHPNSTLLKYHLAILYMFMEKWLEAMSFAQLVVRSEPANPYYAMGYALICRNFNFLQYLPEQAEAVHLAMNNKAVNPSLLNLAWLSLLALHPNWAGFFARKFELTLADVEAKISELKAAGTYNDPFFLSGLRKINLRGPYMEWALVMMRSLYLKRAAQDIETIDDQDLEMLEALSQQCFYNEYAFYVSPDDEKNIEQLQAALKITKPDSKGYEPILLALCTCGPIDKWINVDDAHKLKDNARFAQIVLTQIINRETEFALMKQIPQLTPINDEVSKAVEQMYMENPYPAWISANYGGDPYYLHLDPDPRKRIQVLIAGCGTGAHPVMAALNGQNQQVLAIDLSRRSIAYGYRKVQEMGLTNIEFAQADILELGAINRKFDYIESAGVLHHLREPEKGLQILLDLLKSRGCIRLGLYSEVARKAMVAGREYVAKHKIPSTAEAIRQFRRDVFLLPEGDPMRKLLDIGDFYSISTCRDLVFHIQETRYTMQQLRKLLDDHDLEFHGFYLEIHKLSEFKKRYPNQEDTKNMEYWEAFENEFPDTFSNMYQFLAQKRS